MNTISPIQQILLAFKTGKYVSQVQIENGTKLDSGLDAAEQAITDLINDAIGEDETEVPESISNQNRPYLREKQLYRNQLRQEIRTKLGLTTKEDK